MNGLRRAIILRKITDFVCPVVARAKKLLVLPSTYYPGYEERIKVASLKWATAFVITLVVLKLRAEVIAKVPFQTWTSILVRNAVGKRWRK